MKVNKINTYNNIGFKADKQQIAPLSQQQQSKVNFEKEQMLAKNADSMNANPFFSLGYKLYRTFRFLSEHESTTVPQTNTLDIIA